HLVGDDFFAGAAASFIREHLPGSAYLDQYGGEFPDFLSAFPPAISLPYLADVARLEWAVSRALHAPDDAPLDLSRLAALSADDQDRVRFQPHHSVSLLQSGFPVDEIWRAVLDADDQALGNIDLICVPIFLLVARGRSGVAVTRLQEPAWQFLDALCRGESLPSAIDCATDAHRSNDNSSFLRLRHDRACGVLAQPRALCRSCGTTALCGRDGVLELRHGKARQLGDDGLAVHR